MLTFSDDLSQLNKRDFVIGSVIAVAMGLVFVKVGGRPLEVTFVPGLIISWVVLFYLFIKKIALPRASTFAPLFFLLLAWQFIHFDEEFLTGFNSKFPVLYGSDAYTVGKFVTINMVSYFIFALSCILMYSKGLRFLVLPMTFFVVYGAIGNAIAHTCWAIWSKGYFPGLYTSLIYWLLGPLGLSILVGSKKIAWIITAAFAAVLIPLVTLTINIVPQINN
jgi:hypothetical protein